MSNLISIWSFKMMTKNNQKILFHINSELTNLCSSPSKCQAAQGAPDPIRRRNMVTSPPEQFENSDFVTSQNRSVKKEHMHNA